MSDTELDKSLGAFHDGGKIVIIGLGRIGSGIAEHSERRGIECIAVNDPIALSSLPLAPHPAPVLVFLTMNPARMRSTVGNVMSIVASSFKGDIIFAAPFDISQFANNQFDCVRFSTTRAIGAKPDVSNLLIDKSGSKIAKVCLRNWAGELNVVEIDTADFDKWETAYAFCGVAARAMKRYCYEADLSPNHPGFRLAFRELENLLHWSGGSATEAYQNTATPGGMVETFSSRIIKD